MSGTAASVNPADYVPGPMEDENGHDLRDHIGALAVLAAHRSGQAARLIERDALLLLDRLERRVADALDRRYVHHNPQARVTGDPGQFCKRCETAHPTLEVCPEVDMRPAAEPTAAPEQPKVGADLVADLRYGAEGDGYPLSSEQCAALLRAIGEDV
jgi:hypothetical protein